MAAVLAVEGIVSHRSAAELWGLIQPAGYVEVSVPAGDEPTVRPPAIVHRIKDLRPGLAVERVGLQSPTRCGPSSTSAWSCRGGSFTERSPRGSRPRPSRWVRSAHFVMHLVVPVGTALGVVRAILDGQLVVPRQGGERARAALHASCPKRHGLPALRAPARGVGHRVASSVGSTRPTGAASSRSRSTASSTTPHRGVPARPDPSERARRARLDGPSVHLARHRPPARARWLARSRQRSPA